MLQVNRYVLRLLAVAIVFGSISTYRSVKPAYSIPQNFSGLIALDTNSAEAFFKSCDAKLNSEDYKGAIADLTEAIRINPKDTKAYEARGLMKAGLGDKQGGIKDLGEAARRYQKEGKTSNYKNVQTGQPHTFLNK